MFDMRRREFITLLGGAVAAWPVPAARAQQPQSPVIGFLNPFSPDGQTDRLRGFRQGLADAGYVEGVNLAIEYRWAEGHLGRLPTLAAELVHRRVVLIAVTGGPTPAFAAKGATATIPIIFTVGDDPVRLGLVASLARPGGNVTGINFFANELAAKRLELLRELVPSATRIAVLVNSAEATNTESTLKDVDSAANAMGLQIKKLNASTSREINETFANFARERPDAIFIGPDAFFTARRVQLALLAAFHRLPVIYPLRPFTEAGGLMSYGSDIVDAYRQVGSYAGRILKGATPADLPVVRASKFELVINAETARTLGLTVPLPLLARADEVIE
jgi:putative tryptophan/tyrosine transport system substrate-binding protein